MPLHTQRHSASARAVGTGAATADLRVRWGAEVVDDVVLGLPCRVYRHRPRSAAELLLDAGRWGDRTHLVHGGRRISFAAHEAAVWRVANWLRERGVRPGDRVVLLAANRPEWIVALWATMATGAVCVPANPWWSRGEVEHCLRTCDPALVLTDERRRPLIPAGVALADLEALRPLVDAERPVPASPYPVDEDDPAVILFTSGTTGAPKGVTLSHRSLVANVQSLLVAAKRLPPEIPPESQGRVNLFSMPLFHVGGLQGLLLLLLTGGTVVFLEGRFDPAEVLRIIEEERVTGWGAVPTMLSRVLDHPDLARRDVSSLRSISLGGAAVAPALVERTRASFPDTKRGVATVYGMTESGGGLTSVGGEDFVARPGTVGRALPIVDLRILEPDEHGVGEILARSPGVMIGYWGQPDDTVVDSERWLHTGDVGRIDDEGFVYVLDRCKDVIIRAGENIASVQVEAGLLTHPAVAEAAVVGLPHPDLGEEVAAVIVPHDGHEVSTADLRAHAAEALSYFQVPTAWWVRREPLPVSETGKVQKRELRASWPEKGVTA